MCRGVVLASHALLRAPAVARVADIAICIPVGVSVFYMVAAALGVPELAETRRQILMKFRRAQPAQDEDPLCA